MDEIVKSDSGSAPALLRETYCQMASCEGDAEHTKSRRTMVAPISDCVNGRKNDQEHNCTLGIIQESNPEVLNISLVRPQPLTISPGSSPLSPPRGRTSQEIKSSTARAGQGSPLQAHSPASLIFERDVQEDILISQTSPSIPSHIRTENYIPPVLEASSAAITNNELNPNSVEIVTYNIHQPATNEAHIEDHQLQPTSIGKPAKDAGDPEELALTCQSSETNDIRRLSFISFADVVNAETGEYSFNHAPLHESKGSPTISTTAHHSMSSSPLYYSPVSAHNHGSSPPTSISTSLQGLELSPHCGSRGAKSPLLAVQRPVSPNCSGELNIETMRQALRRTGSGDMEAFRINLEHDIQS